MPLRGFHQKATIFGGGGAPSRWVQADFPIIISLVRFSERHFLSRIGETRFLSNMGPNDGLSCVFKRHWQAETWEFPDGPADRIRRFMKKLTDPLQYIKGVGPKRTLLLKKLHLETV